jgi:hypothetical protein
MTSEEPTHKHVAETLEPAPDPVPSDAAQTAAPADAVPTDSKPAENKTVTDKDSEPSLEPAPASSRPKDAGNEEAGARTKPDLRPAPKPVAAKAGIAKPAVAPKPIITPKPAAEKALAPPPFVPQPSLPVTMLLRPDSTTPGASAVRFFPGELEDDFESALAMVRLAPGRSSVVARILRSMRALMPFTGRPSSPRVQRTVAFDGFRSDLYDEKIERDRRYGTVYSVSEQINAFLVRLELPRLMPASSLKQIWQLPDETPDYEYTLSLANNVLSIRAGLPAEVFRRVSYVSSSFPSDFLTRIEFDTPVEGFKHRLRNKVLEIIVYKQPGIDPKAAA